MTLIYIAGPMSGIPDFNYPAFNTAAKILRARGFDVLNPAENGAPEDHPERSWQDWMRLALGQLIRADEIALLPGWENSKGARLENQIAEQLQMHRYLIRPALAEGFIEELREGIIRQRNLEAIRHEIDNPLQIAKCADCGEYFPQHNYECINA